MNREEYENILGKPDEFIISKSNAHLVKKWAVEAGHSPVEISIMSNVELANLYHGEAGKSKNGLELFDAQQLAADMFIKIMETVKVPGFNVDLTRQITKEEIDRIHIETIAERVARFVTIPKRLEVTSPRGTVTLNGPQHYITETVIKVASIGHAIMLVGPAGCGKTTIGEHTAQALQLPFFVTSTINDTHELTGFVDGHGLYHRTPFRAAYENGGVWIADEIDAWDASALLAANSALANGFATFPDTPQPVARHADFRMIATANTFGNGADRVYVGRNELDAASLDRFAMINVDYDLSLETMFAGDNEKWLNHIWKIRKIVTEKKIRHVVSSRAIIMGTAALNTGIPWNEAEEMYLYKGMSKSDREKCK